MTGTDPREAAPTAVRLIVAAERLFADHSIDGVSLRQIGAEAGSSNKSAVHYHFGSRDELVRAIFRYRLPQIIEQRRMLIARADPDDLRARFEAQYLPVLSLADDPDTRYVSFMEQLLRGDTARDYFTDLPEELTRSNTEFAADLVRLLPHLHEPVRSTRIAQAQALCLHAAADRERAVVAGHVVSPLAVSVSMLLDGLIGYVVAPVSDETTQALRRWTAASSGRLYPI